LYSKGIENGFQKMCGNPVFGISPALAAIVSRRKYTVQF